MHVQGVGLVPGRVRQQREGLAARLVLQRPHVQLQPRPAACPGHHRCVLSATVREAPQYRMSLHLDSQIAVKPLTWKQMLSVFYSISSPFRCWNQSEIVAYLLAVYAVSDRPQIVAVARCG